MNYLGIDVSKEKFDVFVNGRCGQFENNQKGFKALVYWLKKQKVFPDIHSCLESTGKYGFELSEYLYEKGLKVSIVNPFLIKNFALSLNKRNKTDKVDCEVIAKFCEVNNPSLWSPPSKEAQSLKDLTRAVDDLKRQALALSNRMEGKVCKSIEKSFNKVIKSLDKQREVLEEEGHSIISNNKELKEKKELLETIPGIGEQTAEVMLAETGGAPEEFKSSRSLVAYAGLCPSNRQSGSSLSSSGLCKRGSGYFRAKLHFPTMSAIRNNPLIKAFYERLLKNGKTKMQALCACTAKLLRIAYGVLKNGKPFDPNYLNSAFSS